MPEVSTLTSRFAAIQLTMLHLQFRMKKIHDDQAQLSKRKPKTNRDIIRNFLPSGYSCIDMLLSFEHMAQLMSDVFATPELRQHFDRDTYTMLNHTKKLAEKWRPVRNRLGGHIDIDMVEELCVRHGFRGVFLSDDLECDLAVLNLLLLESALNAARSSSDILGRDLEMKRDLMGETKLLVDTINDDWNSIYEYFKPLMELMYRAGKQEKIAVTPPANRGGIVTGD